MSDNEPNPYELPPVPQWWWECGLHEALERNTKEAIALDAQFVTPKPNKPTLKKVEKHNI